MKKNEALRKFISEHPDVSNVEGAKMMGIPPSTYGSVKFRMKNEKPIINYQQKKVISDERHGLRKEADRLIKENKELRKLVDIFNASTDFQPVSIERKLSDKSSKTEATAIVLASDWHLEQRVDPRRLTYHNEYNLQISETRSKQFFQNVVKLLIKEQQSTKIEHLVLWLGGDFISSNIHEALTAICLLGPSQAIIFAQELIIGGIQYLLDNTNVQITCPTSCGNHSRITKKVWISTEEDNSLETIIYHNIKQYFRNEKRFELIMPEGPVTFLSVYGKTLAFAHGHHGVKYQGGIGGLAVPLKRHILRKYSKRSIYMLCIGHFHAYEQAANYAVNGSLIGWDDYSESCGFEYDVPKQTFFLVDKKRESRTVTCPILFDC